MWRPRQKTPCDASGEALPQFRLSREDKGKLPVRFGSFAEAFSRKAKLVTLPSPNRGAVTPCANFALTSEVPNGLAYSAPVPLGTSEVLSHKTGTEALHSASHLRNKTTTKAPQRASLSKSSGVKSAFQSEVKGHPWVLIAVLIQLQCPRVLPEFSAAKLELKHYAVLTAFAVMQRTRSHSVLCFQSPLVLSLPLQKEL